MASPFVGEFLATMVMILLGDGVGGRTFRQRNLQVNNSYLSLQ